MFANLNSCNFLIWLKINAHVVPFVIWGAFERAIFLLCNVGIRLFTFVLVEYLKFPEMWLDELFYLLSVLFAASYGSSKHVNARECSQSFGNSLLVFQIKVKQSTLSLRQQWYFDAFLHWIIPHIWWPTDDSKWGCFVSILNAVASMNGGALWYYTCLQWFSKLWCYYPCLYKKKLCYCWD